MLAETLQHGLGRSGLPDGLGWGVSIPVSDPDALFPEERAGLRAPVPARLAEFTGGRLAARAAMAQIRLPAAPVPPGSDRAPRWPEGVVGSITHGGGLCLAVVGRSSDWRAIGVDLEPDRPLDAALVSTVATGEELERLAPIPREQAALRLFSAKEAAYKAQYPLTGALFGFDAMTADLALGEMRMTQDVGLGRGARLPMRQVLICGQVLSFCLMPRSGPE